MLCITLVDVKTGAHAHRHHRVRHRRTDRRPSPAGPSRRDGLRGRPLRRRAHPHRGRRTGRPRLRDRHRLHRLQPPALPALHASCCTSSTSPTHPRSWTSACGPNDPASNTAAGRSTRSSRSAGTSCGPNSRRMLWDVMRFNREAAAGPLPDDRMTVGEYLARGGYSQAFADDYLLALGGVPVVQPAGPLPVVLDALRDRVPAQSRAAAAHRAAGLAGGHRRIAACTWTRCWPGSRARSG